MNRVDTVPLNLYETETVLKPVNLNLVMSHLIKVGCQFTTRVLESPNNEQVDSFRASDNEHDPSDQTGKPVRTLTSRIADFLQAGMTGV